jgi:phosphoserine aminotransferase
MSRNHNFSAGPGTLPLAVLEEAKEEFLSFGDAGASIIEISHRSKQYTADAESARALLKSHLGLGDDWHVLFLQGGASMQFYQIPLNFLSSGKTADYVDTGAWSKKAIAEAKSFGDVNVVASSGVDGYRRIPAQSEWNQSEAAAYLHYTSNNTIFGTQFHFTPVSQAPIVCDASSDFLCRPMNTDGHSLIYAGAQKNLGPAGVTVVLIKDDFLDRRNGGLPTMLDYGTHASKLFNTPPVFAVYLVEKVLKWLERTGGLSAMQTRNEKKAAELYGRIDKNDFYSGNADVDSRSLMNVTFRLRSEELEDAFVSEAAAEGLVALKGHRSAGGIRASIYNACEPGSVSALVSFMNQFESRHG